MKLYIYLLGLLLTSYMCPAQYVGLTSLFRPGARVGVQYMPTDLVEKEVPFGYSQLRSTLIIPMGGAANLDLKKLKASARQQFLTFNFGARQYELGNQGTKREVGNFSLGFTGVSLSTNSGIWAYTVHAGILNDFAIQEQQPFAMAAVMKIKIKGLNRQDFFGGGLIYAGKRLFPVPLIGIRRKLAKKLHITAIFPVQIDLSKKLSKRTRLSWLNTWNGFSTNMEYVTNGSPQNALFAFSALRSSLIFQWKLSNNLRLMLEGGMNTWSNVRVFDSNRDNEWVDADANFTPYVGVTARFNFGKSLVGSQLFGNDL
ncbi:MAG: DUF6268 family outer membrane beta-barrel protein [Flammeovirgaceae bacterium]